MGKGSTAGVSLANLNKTQLLSLFFDMSPMGSPLLCTSSPADLYHPSCKCESLSLPSELSSASIPEVTPVAEAHAPATSDEATASSSGDVQYDECHFDSFDYPFDDEGMDPSPDVEYYNTHCSWLDYSDKWERTLNTKKMSRSPSQRRPKSHKGPKLRVRVNACRYYKEEAQKSVVEQQQQAQKANSALKRGLERSRVSSSSSSSPSRRLKCGLTSAQVSDIQNRELTPEDYELLLALDESVAKKCLTREDIDKIAPMKKLGDDATTACEGDTCVVCFSEYAGSCAVRTLPCGHTFHSDCIVMWLTNSSVNCPIDGLPMK